MNGYSVTINCGLSFLIDCLIKYIQTQNTINNLVTEISGIPGLLTIDKADGIKIIKQIYIFDRADNLFQFSFKMVFESQFDGFEYFARILGQVELGSLFEDRFAVDPLAVGFSQQNLLVDPIAMFRFDAVDMRDVHAN